MARTRESVQADMATMVARFRALHGFTEQGPGVAARWGGLVAVLTEYVVQSDAAQQLGERTIQDLLQPERWPVRD